MSQAMSQSSSLAPSALSAIASTAVNENDYFAGLIDAQLSIKIVKNEAIRVTLSCNDPRIIDEIREKFDFTRITVIARPNKKDMCTCLFVGDEAKAVLEFAAEHCVVRNALAAKTLEYIDGKASVQDVLEFECAGELDDVSIDWASGFFDVRGIVVPSVTSGEKKTRGSVKLVLPKNEKFIIPALQKVLNGKVKKSSPCRLVFENKNSIASFVDTVKDRVRAKKADLQLV